MRRLIGVFGACVALAVVVPSAWAADSSPAAASTAAKPAAELFLGKEDAPVTLVEYSSLTCSHCAEFHQTTLPKLKEAYIDTGKVKMILRDFPLDRYALTGAVIARCAAPERYFSLIDVLFKQQATWTHASDPSKALVQYGKLAGLTQDRIDACLADTALADRILERQMQGQEKYKITGTPTFVLNDGAAVISGAGDFEEFAAAIDKLLPKK